MEESIILNEKYSDNWKPTLYFSLLLAILAFILYLTIGDVLWSGILRLAAFISFSLSVFCMLKAMEGKKTFRISIKDNHLAIAYLEKEDVARKEVHTLDEIDFIYKEPHKYKLPLTDNNFFLADSSDFKIRFLNSDHDISLFKFGGRVLSVDEKTGTRLQQFLESHNLYSNR